MRCLTLAAFAAALGVMLDPGMSRAASGFDPLNIDSLIAPAPNQPWVPVQPLPSVPVPDRCKRCRPN